MNRNVIICHPPTIFTFLFTRINKKNTSFRDKSMASESSSAVLDLNDADAEDTEAPSVTDDQHEGAPLIMEEGYDIAVKVDAPMKQLSTLETYVTYRVRCVCARWPATRQHVRRRYNHFKALHRRLSASHPLLAPPPLPPLHSARQQLDRYSPAFVAVRTIALHLFLERVAKHPILTYSDDLRVFLTAPDEELDKVFKNENSALNLWGLSSALYGGGGGGGEAKPTNGARVKDPEFAAAAEYLQSLQLKLTTLCALTTKLHKGTAALATELMGMKRACDAWATQAGGRTARAASGCGCGAASAGGALARPRDRPHAHRAALPLLAAYAAAHGEKIRQRDAIHAAHVAGNNTGELHNRLEQASEAIRSELSDWTPKTHSEIKSVLLNLADRQVSIYTQTVMGWEQALKLSTEANIDELFKTVSKTAVQNLSPSKCKPEVTPNETDKDFDDLDYSNDDSDLENDDKKEKCQFDTSVLDSFRNIDASGSKNENGLAEAVVIESESKSDSKMSKLDSNESKSDSKMSKLDSNESKSDSKMSKLDSNETMDSKMSKLDSNEIMDSKMSKLDSNELQSDSIMSKLDSNELKSEQGSRKEVLSDPLQDFSDIDLSS